ncbi:MAG: transglycosylase SLT domain-containing protein [Saprospiraceae bacterium]|nr:transglycosylase SLT domain-containing protein [Saprospiraceae bacterium]
MQLRQLSVLIAFTCLPLTFAFAYTAEKSPSPEIAKAIYKDLFIELTDKELESRILSVTNLLEPKFTSEVKSFLRVYLTSRPEWTEILLGRTAIYFPIFERKIEEKGLPNDLKFVSIIESALRTGARSRVGAQGLWQFMPGTAKMNQLVIDKNVDEREDPYRSTDAALEYLSELYDRYKDWALAIAAYNSGPGRVNQAIAISGTRNFWKLRNYLPKETRNYVPAFLAAAYLMKYYSEYYLTPAMPRLDFQITRSVKIYNEISFTKISDLTGMSLEDIRFLNTSFRNDRIPENKKGYTLMLPARTMPHLEFFLNNLDKKESPKPEPLKFEPFDSSMIDQLYYDHVLYDAQPGEHLHDIAELFNVDKYNIRYWNNMSSDEITVNNPLLVHYIKNDNSILVTGKLRKFSKRQKFHIIKMHSSVKPVAINLPKGFKSYYNKIALPESPLVNLDLSDHYRLRRGESIQDAIRKIPDLSLEEMRAIPLGAKTASGLVIPLRKS